MNLEEVVREKWEHVCWRNETEAKMLQTIGELVKELERLRTVEQAYQALLSATAGQPK